MSDSVKRSCKINPYKEQTYVGVRYLNRPSSIETEVRIYRPQNDFYEEISYVCRDLFQTSNKEIVVEWGFGGSGPCDLALLLLADVVPIPEARTHFSAFFQEVVQHLPRLIEPDPGESYWVEEWTLTEGEIFGWLANRAVREENR